MTHENENKKAPSLHGVRSIPGMETALKHGANINERYSNGDTSLHYYVFRLYSSIEGVESEYGNYRKILEYLLMKGAGVNHKNNKGETPLHMATIRDMPDIVELLLEYGANSEIKNNCGDTPLITACRMGFTKVVGVLLEARSNPNNTGHDRRTALMEACDNLNVDIVKLLIENRANVNTCDLFGSTALHYVVARDYHESDISKYDEILTALLKTGVDVNKSDKDGRTPLMYATIHNREEQVKTLLRKGADITPVALIDDGYGYREITAMDIATKRGYKGIETILRNQV